MWSLRNIVFFGMTTFLLGCAQNKKVLDPVAPAQGDVSALVQPSDNGEMEIVVKAAVSASSRSMHPPGYPPAAFRAGVEGTVVLIVSIDASGSVSDISVEESSGDGDLDKAAVRAAGNWLFYPARTATGAGVPSRIAVPVRFALN